MAGHTHMTSLQSQFGQIDIYLFDQLLRGRIPPTARICDAGCGSGRNLVYLLRAGYDVRAVDADPSAIDIVRSMAASLAPGLPPDNFRAEPVERDVLSGPQRGLRHQQRRPPFRARTMATSTQCWRECWRLLDGNGVFFCRLASSIGIESRVRAVGSGRFLLPDGSERYLVTEARLTDLTERLGGDLIDPLKTTVVQNQRSMTTWVMKKTVRAPAVR
jgi:SAM-dependent methyltransferase